MKFPKPPHLVCAAVLLISATASIALASSFDVVLGWFASRPLSQQVAWQPLRNVDSEDLLKKAYVLGELSNRSYQNSASDRDVGTLGFRELAFFDKSATMDGGDVGAVIGIAVGGAIDVLSGGATLGAGTVIGGIVGHDKIKRQQVTAAALVAESFDHSMRVVALRGSADLPDWIVDANASTVVDDGITYHHGFFLYAGLLYGDVRKALGESCHDGTRVWLTGHSLGGSAAQILAYWLYRDGCDIAGVMSFGSPLPGRDSLQRAYNPMLGDVTHRFMHENDPVACLPLGLDWAQLGHLHSITDESMRLNDTRDLCTGGGDTVAGQAQAMLFKLHDAAEPSTDLAVWTETALHDAGLCSAEESTGRVILGFLTFGGSEVTCRTIDLAADLAVLKDQLVRLFNVALNESNPLKHIMHCSYLERFVEMGSDLGTFIDPIWSQHMEQTWDWQDCSPPQPRPKPPRDRNVKPVGALCCGFGADGKTCVDWAPPKGACP